jgi:hypothetical protein
MAWIGDSTVLGYARIAPCLMALIAFELIRGRSANDSRQSPARLRNVRRSSPSRFAVTRSFEHIALTEHRTRF